jgi:hypothetical protein
MLGKLVGRVDPMWLQWMQTSCQAFLPHVDFFLFCFFPLINSGVEGTALESLGQVQQNQKIASEKEREAKAGHSRFQIAYFHPPHLHYTHRPTTMS